MRHMLERGHRSDTRFPGFLFVGLSAFSWVCWIAPSGLTRTSGGYVRVLTSHSQPIPWSISFLGLPLVSV